MPPPTHMCDAVPEQGHGCKSTLQFSVELADHNADPPVTGYPKKNRYQPSAALAGELELEPGQRLREQLNFSALEEVKIGGLAAWSIALRNPKRTNLDLSVFEEFIAFFLVL